MKRNPDANAEPMDMEDLAALGNSASGPCPYFLSREMAATADIVFMPVSLLNTELCMSATSICIARCCCSCIQQFQLASNC